MPVPLAGGGRDGVAGPDLLTHATAGLDQARTLGDVQHLASSGRRRWLSVGTPVHYLDNLASCPGRAARHARGGAAAAAGHAKLKKHTWVA